MRREDYPRHRQAASSKKQDDIREYRRVIPSHYAVAGYYVAVVKIYQREGRQYIYLYDGEPEEFGFWGLFRDEHDPICKSSGGRLTDVPATIKRMITEWELMLYEKERTENLDDTYWEIDFVAEIKRRGQRFNPEQTHQEGVCPR